MHSQQQPAGAGNLYLAHALLSGARRRRQEFGILRALGMTGRVTRLAVLTQGIVLAVVGLVFGVPLGLAAGRALWRIFADYVPLQYAPASVSAAAGCRRAAHDRDRGLAGGPARKSSRTPTHRRRPARGVMQPLCLVCGDQCRNASGVRFDEVATPSGPVLTPHVCTCSAWSRPARGPSRAVRL
jgi:hypothetical protein